MGSPSTAHPQVAVVLGTRPEIIKLGNLVRLLGDSALVVHTGQHFDTNLSRVFFEAFRLPDPVAHLGVGGDTRAAQIGRATSALGEWLRANPVAAVVVQGDTNSAAAGALAANACEVPPVHVEAGLRSFDRRMPEEHNRVVADHLAELCCAPTTVNLTNLRAEAIPEERIVLTGNTVVEAVIDLLPPAEERAALLTHHGVTASGFVLSTFHRPENVDDPEVLGTILSELAALPLPVILPLHPRTAARAGGDPRLASLLGRLVAVDPLGYREFLGLAAESALLISDSGGVQEEVSVLKRPVIVVRRSTERPEVIGTFAELVGAGPGIGEQARAWLGDLAAVHDRLAGLPSPYGDGTASEKTAAAIRERFGA